MILLDLMMPEMDGFEFAAELHRHPEWRSIPIVVLTAKDLTADELARLNGNVHTILEKEDATREELMHQVRDLLAGWAVPGRGDDRQDVTPGATESIEAKSAMSKILLVEDNETNRDMLSRRLLKRGYEVVIAIDGESGLSLPKAKRRT